MTDKIQRRTTVRQAETAAAAPTAQPDGMGQGGALATGAAGVQALNEINAEAAAEGLPSGASSTVGATGHEGRKAWMALTAPIPDPNKNPQDPDYKPDDSVTLTVRFSDDFKANNVTSRPGANGAALSSALGGGGTVTSTAALQSAPPQVRAAQTMVGQPLLAGQIPPDVALLRQIWSAPDAVRSPAQVRYALEQTGAWKDKNLKAGDVAFTDDGLAMVDGVILGSDGNALSYSVITADPNVRPKPMTPEQVQGGGKLSF